MLNYSARVQPTIAKSDRDHREGVQKKSMTENLAATAQKLADNPPVSSSMTYFTNYFSGQDDCVVMAWSVTDL